MDMDDEDVKELGLSRVRSNALKTLMRQLREASLRFPRVLRSPFPLLLRISLCLLFAHVDPHNQCKSATKDFLPLTIPR